MDENRQLSRDETTRELRLGRRPRTASLWITCGEQSLTRVLRPVLGREPLLFVHRDPCAAWSTETNCLPHIEHAVWQRDIRDIVVCGHSLCSRHASSAAPRELLRGMDSFDELLHRVLDREERNRQGKEAVVRQMEGLRDYPPLAQLLSRGDLSLHGLFYLGESDTFLMYDELIRDFLPLRS